MSQLEKMNQVYEKIKKEVENDYSEQFQTRDFLDSSFTQNVINEVDLVLPFQYSGNEGIYFFSDLESFKEYVMERLKCEGIITSDDYYQSSEEWDSSSC